MKHSNNNRQALTLHKYVNNVTFIQNVISKTYTSICVSGVMVQPMIGFYVCYGRTISSGTTIPFDWVKTNIGNGWNRHYYRFTAPVRGLYFFTLHITISPKNLPSQFHGRAYIMRGNLSIRNVYSHHQSNINAMIPASGSVPVMLNAGEHIWAKYGGGRLYSDGGGQRTYFVGFLIQKAN